MKSNLVELKKRYALSLTAHQQAVQYAKDHPNNPAAKTIEETLLLRCASLQHQILKLEGGNRAQAQAT